MAKTTPVVDNEQLKSYALIKHSDAIDALSKATRANFTEAKRLVKIASMLTRESIRIRQGLQSREKLAITPENIDTKE